jgi:hypothetical protein
MEDALVSDNALPFHTDGGAAHSFGRKNVPSDPNVVIHVE